MHTVDSMINDILRREGGYVDHPNDRGGATNFGVTQKTLSDYLGHDVTKQEVKDLSEELAREIYERNYYKGPGIDRLPESIQAFVFDSAVNHGPRRALKLMQKACNKIGCNPPLDEDGLIGPGTVRGANWAEAEMGEKFLKALLEERRNFYLEIVERNPSQKVFLKGWMNRVDEFEH